MNHDIMGFKHNLSKAGGFTIGIKVSVVVAICVIAGSASIAGDAQKERDREWRAELNASIGQARLIGFTAPTLQAELAPLTQGRIAELPFEEGAFVEKGAVIAVLDDAVQRQRFEMAKADATSTLEVELAQVRMDQAQKELERISVLSKSGRASAKEMLDAQATSDATRIEWQVATHRQLQQERDFELQKTLLEQHKLVAPFGGYISRHLKRVAETVEDFESIIAVTQLSPLEIVFDCPLKYADRFATDSTVRVTPADSQWQPREGAITLVNRVANPASQTFRIKIAVPNEDRAWMSGIKVTIDVPEPNPRSALAEPNEEKSGA